MAISPHSLRSAAGAAGRAVVAAGAPLLHWVRRRVPATCAFGLAFTALAVVCVDLGVYGRDALVRLAGLEDRHVAVLAEHGMARAFEAFAAASFATGLALAAAAILAFVRHRLALAALRAAGAAFAAVWAWLLLFIVRVPALLFDTSVKGEFAKSARNQLWVEGVWAWVPLALIAAAILFAAGLSAVRRLYGAPVAPDGSAADRAWRSLRSGGTDPAFRRALTLASFSHLFVIFILPLLLLRGCMEDPYGIPRGTGDPLVQIVKIRKIKKPPKQRIVLNLNSPILFYRPDIDESMILKEIDNETLDTYQASAVESQNTGKTGGKPGWPGGMENAVVRFIRLEYGGGDWDQDMGVGSDLNLLIEFRKITGFRIAENTEHIPIRQLRRFPRHRGPPFVFITGQGGLSATPAEVETLRWYCIDEGGMLFADNGGGVFDMSFRALIQRAFPELKWVDIPNDDILFRQPFAFPNGAPPLWHHSGKRALGLKHNGRWIVFYHPGDLNDAWKDGHSGASPEIAAEAHRMGINVMNYAFNQYLSRHAKGAE